MRRNGRTHSPEFKAKLALAAIPGDLTITERVTKFDVHANQITDWKQQLLSNASDVFGKGVQKAGASAETIKRLHANIGQLTMENGCLGRGLERSHGPGDKKW
jgi:transposase-like protein